MIRFFYWLVAIVEAVLLFGIILFLILTDSRSVKILADETLSSYDFRYDEISGNLFSGLEVVNLSYKDETLFNTAIIHWNPLSLIYKRVTFTKVDVEGVELQNILNMVEDLSSEKSENNTLIDLDFVLKGIHLDINPYLYEGVRFSSFLFESDRIRIASDLTLNSKKFNLSFDSDLVNTNLDGAIKNNNLSIGHVDLGQIDSRAIAVFVKRLNQKEKNKTVQVQKDIKTNTALSEAFLKSIEIEKIKATLLPVTYEPLVIKETNVVIDNLSIDSNKSYELNAKKITVKGNTNFGSIDYKGDIQKSMIETKGEILLRKALFTRYNLPLEYENLKKLPSDLKLNYSGVWLDIHHDVTNLLKKELDFPLKMRKVKHQLYYDFKDLNLSIQSKADVKIPYSDEVKIENLTTVDALGKTLYKGKVEVTSVNGLPVEVSDYLLEGLKGEYRGDTNGLDVEITSKLLKGQFVTSDFERGKLTLQSKEQNIILSKLIKSIPMVFAREHLKLQGDALFDFKNSQNSKINLDVISNIMNLNSKMELKKPYTLILKGSVPTSSVLVKWDKNVKVEQFQNIGAKIVLGDILTGVSIENQEELGLSFNYDNRNGTLQGLFNLANEQLIFNGNYANTLKINANNLNINKLIEVMSHYYTFTVPTVEGNVNMVLELGANRPMVINLESPEIRYIDKSGIKPSITKISNIATTMSLDKNNILIIEKYKFKFPKNDYFDKISSKKKSFLYLDNEEVVVKQLWINDQIGVDGYYNFQRKEGDFHINANPFSYRQKKFDVVAKLALLAKIRAEKIEVNGDVELLGNRVSYEVVGSGVSQDGDIVILGQVVQKEQSSLSNLKLLIKVSNKTPIIYDASNVNVELYNDLTLIKDYDEVLSMSGMSTIAKGYYRMEDKKFLLNESHIYFAGNPQKPYLDIKADYHKDEYKVHIFISGDADEPIVNFTSEPFLTQQEILSLILFDGTGSSSGQGAEAYTILGGTFAKSLIKSLGVSVDHLLLGTDMNDEVSLEVGRKISDNMTLMYLHENGKDGAKVRIEHSNNFETDIIIQPPNSSSIEFLYRKD